MLWSLLLFPLPAFPTAGFWFGRPRGRGVWSSTCPCSIASWTFPTVAWYPSSLFSCLSDRGIGWPPSIFGRRILGFLCLGILVTSCALWLMAALTDSMRCASVCPRPRRSSFGLWLLYPFFIPWVSVSSLPGRLARPGIVPGGPPPGSQGCLLPLSRVEDRGLPGVVHLLSVSGGTFSRGGHRRTDFSGFSIARSRLQAAVPLQRLLSSAALLLACGSRFWGCCPLCHIWFQGAACG